MKTIKILALIFVVLMALCGCWDKQELNDISVVTGIAIDKGSGEYKYKLTVEILNAGSLNPRIGESLTPTITTYVEGNTIAELSNKLNLKFTRRLIYSHLKTLVLSKEVAQEGMVDFIDYLERNKEFRDDFGIVISVGKAEDILKIMYPLQRVSAIKIYKQMETMEMDWGGSPNVRISDFISAIISKGREPVLTEVNLVGSTDKGDTMENMQTTELDAIVIIEGMSIFKDMKYLGMLSPHDARTWLWLQGDLKRTSLTVPCNASREDSFLSVQVNNSETSIKTDFKEGKPIITIDIVFEGRLDSTQCKDDLTAIATFTKYEELVAKAVESEIIKTIKKVQEEYKVDIFGFGELFEREHYSLFQEMKDNWNEKFSNAEFFINVSPRIRRTGLNTNSFNYEEE